MGWKGTLRTFTAAARAAERESQRRHKQAVKEQVAADAANAVENWEDYIDELTSIHTDVSDAIDWQSLASKTRPEAPRQNRDFQDAAAQALAAYKPGFFDVFKGGSKRRLQRLEDAVSQAPKLDLEAYERAKREHIEAVAEWENDSGLAVRLLQGETVAIKEVVSEMQSFTQESLIGASINFSISTNHIHATPEIHTDEIVPSVRRKQLASGKLSESKMPAGQFNELYQDYVASVALKVAGDLFHILPLPEVYVTCVVRMLNPKTGHQELTPILSVQFVRDTFLNLNLANIDPSDSMDNFRHEMKFSRTKGFSAIAPLEQLG